MTLPMLLSVVASTIWKNTGTLVLQPLLSRPSVDTALTRPAQAPSVTSASAETEKPEGMKATSDWKLASGASMPKWTVVAAAAPGLVSLSSAVKCGLNDVAAVVSAVHRNTRMDATATS